MKAHTGMDNTRTSVTIVKKEIDVMKAAECILCWTGIVSSQYEAIGSVMKIDAMHAETVRQTLIALIAC